MLRNLGDGTFAGRVSLAVGHGPYSIVAADLDKDGQMDLATANTDADTVSVLRNLGSGAFATAITYNVGRLAEIRNRHGCGPRRLARDLVTANNNSNTISVLRNLGDGTLLSPGGRPPMPSGLLPTPSSPPT